MIGEELRQPFRHLPDRGIRIAVLVEETSIANFETHVVEAVCNRVDQFLAAIPGASTIILNPVKTGLRTRLVIAMQQRPLHLEIAPQVGVHRADFGSREHLVSRSTRRLGRLHDQLVQAVGCLGARLDVLPIARPCQTGVTMDVFNDLVETGSCDAVGGSGDQAVGSDT